jgi:heme exporter protein D
MTAIDHFGFIAGAYGFAVVVVGGLTAWVMLDYRAQRRHLADLESQGVIRRSAPQGKASQEPGQRPGGQHIEGDA